MPVVLIPIDPKDRSLIRTMTARTAPRALRIAACLALEGRRVVLPRGGHPVYDHCLRCGTLTLATVIAFHKSASGDDARCVVGCDACGRLVEDRLLSELESRPQNPLRGLRDVF